MRMHQSRSGPRSLRLPVAFLFCFLLLAFTFVASAQEATIVGSVTDQSGLAVPNVTITILNAGNGQNLVLTSNEVGQFIAPALLIGTYSIKAEAKGFKTWSQSSLTLRQGDRTRLDIQLQIGQTSEQVTVESGILQVQSVSSEVSDVVTGTQVRQPELFPVGQQTQKIPGIPP